jgi:uncharacterized protein (DUF1697 family)
MTMSPKPPANGERYVALLRGINLGPHNKLPMPALCAAIEGLGARNVKHYIQSGNLAFEGPAKVIQGLGPRLSRAIAEQWGYHVPVVVRARTSVSAVLAANPFLQRGEEAKALHVAFLGEAPLPSCVAALDPARSPGDEFVVAGTEIYLLLPNGVARTKFNNDYFERALGTVSTLRNWNTVQKLAEL